MKFKFVFGFVALVFSASMVAAQTTTNLVITPSSPVFDCKNVAGVGNDAAPGFPFGSFASTGGPPTLCASGGLSSKTDMYFKPEDLFGRQVALGEVARMSYWTKVGTTHLVDVRDWALIIYTKPYLGQARNANFYAVRLGLEPYFAVNLTDPANTWNQWRTLGATNQLRVYESTNGAFGANFGTYTDPDWLTRLAGNSLSGPDGGNAPLAPQPILFFTVQTGSATAPGFTGQLDGYRIELIDGSVANINFEATNPVATNKDQCKNNGWMSLTRSDFSTFKNQGDCVQYANTGK
jgi:hypothetical protein